jgi:hypothetical protein
MDYYSAARKNEIMSFEGKIGGTGSHSVEPNKPRSKSQILHVFAHLQNPNLK